MFNISEHREVIQYDTSEGASDREGSTGVDEMNEVWGDLIWGLDCVNVRGQVFNHYAMRGMIASRIPLGALVTIMEELEE